MAVFSCLKSDEDTLVQGKKSCFLKRTWKGLKRRLRRRANRERKILKEMVANAERPKIVRKEIKESDDVYKMIRELKTCDCWYYPDLFKPHFVRDRNENPEVISAQLEPVPEEQENEDDSDDKSEIKYEIADIEKVLDVEPEEDDSDEEFELKYEIADIEKVLDKEDEESELKYEIADIERVLGWGPKEHEEESELKYELADIERVLDDVVDESDSDEESGLLYEIEDIERVLDVEPEEDEEDESALKYEIANIERVIDGVVDESDSDEESGLLYEIEDIERVLDGEREEYEEEEESELNYEIAHIERVLDDVVDESDYDEESGLQYELPGIERVLDGDLDDVLEDVKFLFAQDGVALKPIDESILEDLKFLFLENDDVPETASFDSEDFLVEQIEDSKVQKQENSLGSDVYSEYKTEVDLVAKQLDEAVFYWMYEYNKILAALPISKTKLSEGLDVFDELLMLKLEDKFGDINTL